MSEYESLLSRGGISLERLATLCRVVEEGGLSKAAGGDVSKLSLYSRQLKELESFFGVPLGRKVGRVVIPTAEARGIAAAARAQFKALQSFVGATSASADFSLGASHSVLEWHILPRLPALADSLGARRLRLVSMRTRELVVAVEDHRLEMALVRSDAVPRSLKAREVMRLGYGLFVPKELLGKRSARQVLASVPLAVSLGGRLREQVDEAAARDGVGFKIGLECASFTLAAQAVRSGRYAAILPDIAAITLDPDAIVRLALPLRLEPSRAISAIWHPSLGDKAIPVVARVLAGP